MPQQSDAVLKKEGRFEKQLERGCEWPVGCLPRSESFDWEGKTYTQEAADDLQS